MAKVVVKQKQKKAKRKYPVEVKAPEYLNSYVLGRSQVTDLTAFVGKTAKVNLMYITGNVKNQNVRLTFSVTEVSSGLATTEVKVYEQIPYYLGRLVRQGSDLVEDSFETQTKDGRVIRVKPFIVTKQNTSGLILSQIRKEARDLIEKEVGESTLDEFMNAVIGGRVQLTYRNELRKLMPLKAFEFRKVELVE